MPYSITVNSGAKLTEAPLESSVLVLNQNYQPLNICTGRRAIMLLIRGKAELLIQGTHHFTFTKLPISNSNIVYGEEAGDEVQIVENGYFPPRFFYLPVLWN